MMLLLKKKSGFTLIELMVVVAVLSILLVIAIPKLSGFVEEARMASVRTNARNSYTALKILLLDKKTFGSPSDDQNYSEYWAGREDIADFIKVPKGCHLTFGYIPYTGKVTYYEYYENGYLLRLDLENGEWAFVDDPVREKIYEDWNKTHNE